MLYFCLLSLTFVNSSLKQTSQAKLVIQYIEARVQLKTEGGARGLLLFNWNSIFWVILLFCDYSVSTSIAKPTSCDPFTQYLKTSISEMFYNLLRAIENTHIMKTVSFSSSVLLVISSDFLRLFQKNPLFV